MKSYTVWVSNSSDMNELYENKYDFVRFTGLNLVQVLIILLLSTAEKHLCIVSAEY